MELFAWSAHRDQNILENVSGWADVQFECDDADNAQNSNDFNSAKVIMIYFGF